MTMPFPILADERELAARALADPASFGTLYEHYYPRIAAYVRFRIDDLPSAEDVISHTFERALLKLDCYRPERAAFGAWLFGIARHCVGSYFQAQRRRRLLSLDFLRERASDQPGLEEVAARSEQQRGLQLALQGLKPRERDIVGLRFGAQLTNRQIAELTGLSESNVGIILYRTMQRLRALLGEEASHD